MSIATASIPSEPTPARSARDLLRDAEGVIRQHVRTVGATARGSATSVLGSVAAKVGRVVAAPLRRLGDAAERYVGAKIKRRVQPPIVLALVVGGVALVIALVVLLRK